VPEVRLREAASGRHTRGRLPIQKVYGNTLGLKPSHVKKLERIYRRRIPTDRIVTPEFARALCAVSSEIGRQVGVLADRRGYIHYVVVGNARHVLLPDVKHHRTAQERLSGLRFLHTHLHQEPLSQEDLTDLAVLRLDLLAAIRMDAEGLPQTVQCAHLVPNGPREHPWSVWDPVPIGKLETDFGEMMWNLEKEFSRITPPVKEAASGEKALLVGVATGSLAESEESLEELKELARSSGVSVLETFLQRRPLIDPRFVIGKGKLRDVVIQAHHMGAQILIFDCNLTPAQVKAIADFTELKVVDRTQVILDIFSQHASSRDGKLQVELAQLRYMLPRLVHKNTAMSRLMGGIGGRGPGETKLEIDRRRVRERIHRLETDIEELRQGRALRRMQRLRSGIPLISLVGYTNAGKSTLLNALTRSRVSAEARMFTTLDPSTRRLVLPDRQECLLTDTVGFIRDLPPDLVAAFRATLEELENASLLLHVIDSSSQRCEAQISIVEGLLDELGLSHIPTVKVFNKTDLASPIHVANLCRRHEGVPVCALQTDSLSPLLERIQRALFPAGCHPSPASPTSPAPCVV